ncbi:MAG: pyridoxal phosphate-dependent aminotransferase [Deltaproteobacteria bacterium]|jgi:cystathionine beta-lyase|nr:pyridoxal phosphate-dependent aminotransferase [Deltaproteobacteria bacterium]
MKHDFDEVFDRRGTDSSKWRKYPADVLPMWVADSDFKCPQVVVDAVTEFARHGAYGYPYADDGAFEQAAVEWMRKRFGWRAETSMVDFVPSLCTALALAVKSFTEEGDSVLMLTPVYPPFHAVAGYNHRLASDCSLIWKNGSYHIDFDDFERRAAEPRTKLFLHCHPHNPSGRAFTREELERIGDICLRHKVIIFSDEIHCDYVFRGKHIPMPTLSEEIAANTVVGINPSKTFNIAGMRTAAVITPNKSLQARFQGVLRSCELGRNPFGVLAFVKAYRECDDYANQLYAYIEKNLDFAVDFLNTRCKGKIAAYKPDATYLLWLDCKELGLGRQEALEVFFLEKAKVALNSGTSFGIEGEGFMRLNTACPRATLAEGLKRIEKAVQAL